jgi:hypothetical protein
VVEYVEYVECVEYVAIGRRMFQGVEGWTWRRLQSDRQSVLPPHVPLATKEPPLSERWLHKAPPIGVEMRVVRLGIVSDPNNGALTRFYSDAAFAGCICMLFVSALLVSWLFGLWSGTSDGDTTAAPASIEDASGSGTLDGFVES